MADRAQRWCFTINNPAGTLREELRVSAVGMGVTYFICGNEVGEKGTPHLQGFVNMGKTTRFNAMKKWLPGAHLERARGSDEENKKYCSKGGDFVEVGAPSTQGKRTDLESAVELLKETRGDLKRLAEEMPSVFIKYGRGLRDYVSTVQMIQPRNWKPRVIVIVGHPGVGKTRWVADACAGQSTYWKPRGKWWDGYTGQENVVIDDFYGWLPYDQLLRLLDRYPMKVEVKGGYVEFVAKKIYITSNKIVMEWYHEEDGANVRYNMQALHRRITSYLVYECGVLDKYESFHPIDY